MNKKLVIIVTIILGISFVINGYLYAMLVQTQNNASIQISIPENERDSLKADVAMLITERDSVKALLENERDSLKAEVATLITERDAALTQVDMLSSERDALQNERDYLIGLVTALTTERDNLKGQVSSLIIERDEALAK